MRWEQQQLRRMARIRNGADHSAVVDPNGEIPVYGSGGEFTRATRALYKGPAVLLGRKGTINRPILVDGEFWTVDTMFCALPLDGTEPRFLYYACTTIPFDKLSTNTALPSMTQGDLNATRIPQPPAKDQQLIADFLDRETAKIDALIAKQEQLIATLREDRIATITHAVTKGLDPNAEMKNSGVEWLGEIPAGWSCQRMSWLFGLVSSGATPDSGNPDYYDGPYNWVTTGELRETGIASTARTVTVQALKAHSALKIYPAGSLVIAMYGATIGRLGILQEPACTNQACCVFSGARKMDTKYAFYALMAAREHLLILASGGGQPNINQDKLRALRIPLPPANEQHRIVEHLDARCAQIDALIAKSEQMIGVLREYRSALITDAVTGKIDVRGAA